MNDLQLRERTCYLDGCDAPARIDSVFCAREHALSWIEQNPGLASRTDLATLIEGPAYPTYDDWSGPVKAAATKAGRAPRKRAARERRID